MADTDARQPRTALADLPDDVRNLVAPHMTEDVTTLAEIGVAIARKRDEAKTARTSSGIEATWMEAEEAYIGIDDANRSEFTDARWAKPMSVDGPVTTGRMPSKTDHKSTVFVRLTARYVDAGAAKLGEILLPPDDKAFSFSEMPVPELIKAKEDQSQVVHEGLGVPLTRPLQPGEVAPPGPAGAMAGALAGTVPGVPAAPAVPAPPAVPGAPAAGAPPGPPAAAPAAPPQVPLTVADLALEAIEIARKSAKAAETRIYDWMVECQYDAHMRKVIFDGARIGVGVVKAPYPKPSQSIAVTKGHGGGAAITFREDVSPATAWVDPWNIFPDPACGENIHDGDYIFERDFLSARQVRNLKKVPGYITAQIDLGLEEGPEGKATDEDVGPGGAPARDRRKERYQIWYYYGSLKREEITALDEAAGNTPSTDDSDQVYAIVSMINDRPVRATINPLDSGSFPYHSFPWQRRAGHWAGMGVAEQMKASQRVTNAAVRAMLNNAGKSAGSQFVVDRGAIIPADGRWTVTPDKFWYLTADGMGRDVRELFAAIQIPNMTEQLMAIVNFGMQLAEESTSIPLVTQGQSGETTPETFGATQLQDTNANQLLRSIGYSFDDFITEPVVRQYYEWLLLDPDVPDDEKGEFKINAHGSAALVERAIQDQTIGQMGQMVANPIYRMDPKKWAVEFMRSKRLDPAAFKYTPEEDAKLDATPPPDPPPVAVAKIAAQTAATALAAKQTTDQRSATNEAQIAAAAHELEGGHIQNDAQRIEAEQQRTQVTATVKLHELQTRERLAMLEYANRTGINLDKVKSELARTAMQLQTERELNAQNQAGEDRKHRREIQARKEAPAVQAPGRAANGHAADQSTNPA